MARIGVFRRPNTLSRREPPGDSLSESYGRMDHDTSYCSSRLAGPDAEDAPAAARGQRRRAIGRVGTVARIVIGLALLALAVTVYRADVRDVVLGVVVLPAAATLLLGLRGRGARPLRLGAAGHLATIVIVQALSFVFRGATVLLFYGSAMLLAAASGNGGCEVTAVSNWLRRRDDQVGCPLFTPFDALDGASGAEHARGGRA